MARIGHDRLFKAVALKVRLRKKIGRPPGAHQTAGFDPQETFSGRIAYLNYCYSYRN